MTTTKYAPGSEVWIAPDPDSADVYSVARAIVVSWVGFAELYEVATRPGWQFPISPSRVYGSEADALANRRTQAALDVNLARERIAAAEAFLNRP